MRLLAQQRERAKSRRGAALAYCMSVFVLVTISGMTLIAVNYQYQAQGIHYGLMSRLRAATENALESTRGRFTLVQTTQENWDALIPGTGWNNIQTVVVNGVTVQVSARSVGTAAVPRCRLRAVGTLSGRIWASEYEFKMTTFGDFALYTGGTNTQGIPANCKINGGYYSKPSINLVNRPDIEFFKAVATSGTVMNAPDPVYNFKEGYTQNVEEITFQPAITTFNVAKTQAQATSTVHYANTYMIELRGTVYRRYYTHRVATSGGGQYQNYVQDLAIPNNGIIYIEADTIQAAGLGAGVDANAGMTNNNSARPNTSGLDVWGWLDGRKVSIYVEDKVTIKNNVMYQSLITNPNLRRFSEKESPAAKAIPELLGVISNSSLGLRFTDFTPMPTSQNVTDNAAYVSWDGRVWNDVGHQVNQYAVDGVFVGYDWVDQTGPNTAASGKEFWLCGSIISGTSPVNNLLDLCYRTNIDWDWRLEEEDPPFLIKTYGQPPKFIAGTFRSYQP